VLFLEFSLLLYMEGKLISGKRQVADFKLEFVVCDISIRVICCSIIFLGYKHKELVLISGILTLSIV
jgi:hypothetical protein